MLNILEYFVQRNGYEYRSRAPQFDSVMSVTDWNACSRLDGQVQTAKRDAIVQEFNQRKNIFIFLISTR